MDGTQILLLPWFPDKNNTCVNICNTVHVPRSFGTFDLKKSTYFRKRINVTQGTPFRESAIIGLSQKLQKGSQAKEGILNSAIFLFITPLLLLNLQEVRP